MEKLTRLCDAVRAITPQGEIRFKAGHVGDTWVCLVVVAGVILVESPEGTTEAAIDDAIAKLRGMSKRMKSVIDPNET